MTLPDDILNIETPENVAFGYQIAGIGSRFLAALVDTLLITLLQSLVILILFLFLNALFDFSLDDLGDLGSWLFAAAGLLAFTFYWGYYIFFEMIWNGQSPGKRWVGLRVLRADGTPVTLSESIIRNLVRLVDFLPAYYGIGVITMFIDERSRRLGDLAAGTLVVRDRGPVSLASLEARPAAAIPQAVSSNADWPVELLSAADLQIAEDFLRRREELFNRPDLSQHIAQTLCERMGFPSRTIQWPESEKIIGQIVQASRTLRSGEK
jgi:uncharacterized RDD family membrane protein YckC